MENIHDPLILRELSHVVNKAAVFGSVCVRTLSVLADLLGKNTAQVATMSIFVTMCIL